MLDCPRDDLPCCLFAGSAGALTAVSALLAASTTCSIQTLQSWARMIEFITDPGRR
jgi:hypothetical protein